MTKNLYLNLLIAVVILLLGYYYSYITDDFWTSRIIGITTSIVSGFTLIGFNYKNLPKKQNEPIKAIQLIAIVIGFSGLILLINYFGYLIYSFLDWELEKQIRPNENELLRYLILIVIWVVIEEIYYRRIIAQEIFNKNGIPKALWISSLIFSIGHWFSDTGLLYAFIGGIILGYIYLKTKSIWLSIFAHMYFNLMTFFITPELIKYSAQINTKPKMIGMILIGMLFISIMVFLIKKSKENQFESRKPVGNNVYKK
jgi:membrane protease YdiL (CAAX protease family)